MERISNAEYRKRDGISRSELNVILQKTPMHFLYEQMTPKEDTPSLLFGRAVHKAILEPESFFDECKKHISDSKRYLTKDRINYVWHEKWKLYAPENIKNIVDKGVSDYDAI